MNSNWSRRKFLLNASLGCGASLIASPALSGIPHNQKPEQTPHDVMIGTVSISGVNADSPAAMVKAALGFMNEMSHYKPDIICLPEGFAYANLNNYSYKVKDEANAADIIVLGPMRKFAAEHKCYVICPTYTTASGKEYISAVLIDRSGKIIGEYHKMRPTAGEMETGVTPGKMDPPVFDTDFGKIGIQICFDIKYEEGWNALKEKGARIIFWPSAYASGIEIASRAWKHQVYVVTSTQKDTSKICDLTGEAIAHTSRWQPHWACAPVNMEKVLLLAWPTVSRISDLQKKYGSSLSIKTYGEEEWLVLESLDKNLRIDDVMKTFGLKPMHTELKELDALQASTRE
jgi:beta-ureidopropionase